MEHTKTLLFVYNADSGLVSGFMDVGHKIFSPETYSCNLCTLTYGIFNMRKGWKEFLDSIGMKVDFVHRDEFMKQYPIFDNDFPAVYCIDGDDMKLFIAKDELNSCATLDQLKELVQSKLGVLRNSPGTV